MIRERFQSAAALLRKLLTVDGSGSGLDADKVDGVEVSDLHLIAGLSGNTYYGPVSDRAPIASTPTADRMYFAPVSLPAGSTAAGIYAAGATGTSAGSFKLLVYGITDGGPGALLWESQTLAFSGGATVGEAHGITLPRRFFLAYWGGSITSTIWHVYPHPAIAGSNGVGPAHRFYNATFGGTTPANVAGLWSWGSNQMPWVGVRG